MTLLVGSMLRLVYTTVSNLDDAKSLASAVVSERLAACVNIAHINSIYIYDEKLVDGDEYSLLMKTSDSVLEGLISFLDETHPYDTPAIIIFHPCSANSNFVHFVETSVHSAF